MAKRERWSSRIGIVLAMAGSAAGLGNFLRFPVQVASNGSGSFMIPYFISLIVIGVPMVLSEWAMGRYGGMYKHGTLPGIFDVLWKNRWAKYLGVPGLVLPTVIMFYYLYIGSWTMSYAFFSFTNDLSPSIDSMHNFLIDFQGINSAWGVSWSAYLSFLATNILLYLVLSGGIAKGIERLAKIGMPALFFLAIFLIIRIFTLGTPNPETPENNIVNGLGYLWNPDPVKLLNPKTWLSAAGQVFFTISIGLGAIPCYASYLRRKDDIVVSGLSMVSANAMAEVVLGGSIAIPLAFAFFGLQGTEGIAHGGAYNLGFVAMPAVFTQIAGGRYISFAWFALLFLAAIIAVVSIAQPAISFLEDELKWTRRKAVNAISLLTFVGGHIPVLGLKYGTIDEIDFWAGTIGLAAFAFLENMVFVRLFGSEKAWKEIHIGAEMRMSRIFLFFLKWVTPVAILAIFISWGWQEGLDTLFLTNVGTTERIWRWSARLLIIAVTLIFTLAVRAAWKKNKMHAPKSEAVI